LTIFFLTVKNPTNYKNHPKTKLLAKVTRVIRERILQNPQDPQFNLGNTLDKEYREYKRAKSGLPTRYRLFFRFNSFAHDIVILWMNDQFTLRKAGSKKDVYQTFLRMLRNGKVPQRWSTLVEESKKK
jgi:toxin YhaV